MNKISVTHSEAYLESISLLREAYPWLAVQLKDYTTNIPELEPLRVLIRRISERLCKEDLQK